ncbi:hypothetical protein PUV44_08455 [Xanthomonas arboricola pv. corylina]|nr:hypothetical protein PUV44_08455 [Xanthomonas arboricola pv. corylina]
MMELSASAPPTSTYATRLAIKADRLFLWLAVLQSVGSLGLAWYQGQWTTFLAVTLPSLLLMAWQVQANPGTRLTRITNALVLMALVAATIQQAHGLVEMHFGVFVILALLLYYRDWLPVVVAAGAIAVHHLAFYWLQSRGLPVQAFTVGSGFGIVVLHAGYVIVETAFVCVMAIQLRRQVDALDHEAEALAELADTLATGATLPPAILQQPFRSGSLAQALVRMSVQVEERIAQQQQLLLENRRIRLALDASAMAVAIVDGQGAAIYRNQSFQQLSTQVDAHVLHTALADAVQLGHDAGSSKRARWRRCSCRKTSPRSAMTTAPRWAWWWSGRTAPRTWRWRSNWPRSLPRLRVASSVPVCRGMQGAARSASWPRASTSSWPSPTTACRTCAACWRRCRVAI